MLKILHLSDIHLGSGFSHGRINPVTGLNTRFEDFVQTLSRCMDRAIAEPVDLVLFGGDAFPDATPLPLVQEAFAKQFHRLVDAGIPVVLLVGNHDQHAQGQGGASLCIYRALGVPGVVVGDRLETHRIQTRSGAVQVITLPWLTRSTLLTRPETEGMSLSSINDLLIDRLRVALEGEIRQLDPELPTVLLAHLMTDTASFGAEKFLAVGKGFTVPMALLTRPCFDYVALGHVHRHQVLCEEPLVVYPGSIERVDFSEEQEQKGYVLVHLERGRSRMEFCPLPVRPFLTIRADISAAEDPLQALLQEIQRAARAIASDSTPDVAPQAVAQAAVVRLIYHLQADQLDAIDSAALQAALSFAHTYAIYPELISQLARPRLPELNRTSGMDPLEALQTYLNHQSHLQDLSEELLAAARHLLTAEAGWRSLISTTPTPPESASLEPPPDAQLRLL